MKSRYIFTILTAMLLCCGCATNELTSEELQEDVYYSIESWIPQDGNADPEELIYDWWIAVADKNGKVCRIAERPADKTEAVQGEESHIRLSAGDYTVYAFANIDREDFADIIVLNQPMPDLSDVIWNREIGSLGSRIPMTGFKTVKVTKNSSFVIEVVRLWAKMQFRFTSNASQPVTINKISMTPAFTSAVSLMPDYQSLTQSPVLPAGTECKLLERPVDLTINKGDESVDETFYLYESTAASHSTGHYLLSFDMLVGGAKRTVSALAYQLAYINRNDFITIPVLITDWDVQFDVRFYPPIGGYPAVIVDNKGDEFYARFGTSGFFEITIQVSDRYTGAAVAAGNVSVRVSVDSGVRLFTQLPAFQNGEIVGELAEDRTGTAVINLDVTIKNGSIQQTITRKLYIIRN